MSDILSSWPGRQTDRESLTGERGYKMSRDNSVLSQNGFIF